MTFLKNTRLRTSVIPALLETCAFSGRLSIGRSGVSGAARTSLRLGVRSLSPIQAKRQSVVDPLNAHIARPEPVTYLYRPKRSPEGVGGLPPKSSLVQNAIFRGVVGPAQTQ